MARHETVVLVDDLSGEEAESVRTREFTWNGVDYEIDLDEANSNEFDDVMAVYVENARRVGGRAKQGTRKSSGSAATDRAQNQAVRAWAQQNGYEISPRGRIPGNVAQAYHEQAGRGGLAAVS